MTLLSGTVQLVPTCSTRTAGLPSPVSLRTAVPASPTTPPSGRCAGWPSAVRRDCSPAPSGAATAPPSWARSSSPPSSPTSTRRPGSPTSSPACPACPCRASHDSCPGTGLQPRTSKKQPDHSPHRKGTEGDAHVAHHCRADHLSQGPIGPKQPAMDQPDQLRRAPDRLNAFPLAVP